MSEKEKIEITSRDLADDLVYWVPGLPPTETRALFKTILNSLQDALVEGNRVEIRGFGSFTTKYRQGGQRRNPRTGASVYAPARYVVAFRAGKELRESIDFTRRMETKTE